MIETKKNKFKLALFYSALVLPGSGQVSLGFKIKGYLLIFFTLLSFITLLVTFTVQFFIQAREVAHQISFWNKFTTTFKNVFDAQGSTLLSLLAILLILWIISIVDILYSKSKGDL
ncbi:MAG: hypothetical protein HYU97_01855 [Deltaproteobacteria bacterium]|nr:hypothetical protein [Deltaproteobacteria bacterium]